MIARSDEIFASSSGVAHPAHCLTRKDVAVFSELVEVRALATSRQGGDKFQRT